jgi:hypothetical protein
MLDSAGNPIPSDPKGMLTPAQAKRVRSKVSNLKYALTQINVDPSKIIAIPVFKVMVKQYGLRDISLQEILGLAVALRALHPDIKLDPHQTDQTQSPQQIVDEIGKRLESNN